MAVCPVPPSQTNIPTNPPTHTLFRLSAVITNTISALSQSQFPSGTRVRYQDAHYIVIGAAERGRVLIQNEDNAEDILRVEPDSLVLV